LYTLTKEGKKERAPSDVFLSVIGVSKREGEDIQEGRGGGFRGRDGGFPRKNKNSLQDFKRREKGEVIASKEREREKAHDCHTLCGGGEKEDVCYSLNLKERGRQFSSLVFPISTAEKKSRRGGEKEKGEAQIQALLEVEKKSSLKKRGSTG